MNISVDELREALRLELKVVTVYVVNLLDKPVTVQVKGNRQKDTVKAVDIGSSFTVAAGGADARTLSPETSGWLPYLTLTLSCTAAPTSGHVTAYRIRQRGDEEKIVKELAIRDTAVHDAETDPDKILIVEW